MPKFIEVRPGCWVKQESDSNNTVQASNPQQAPPNPPNFGYASPAPPPTQSHFAEDCNAQARLLEAQARMLEIQFHQAQQYQAQQFHQAQHLAQQSQHLAQHLAQQSQQSQQSKQTTVQGEVHKVKHGGSGEIFPTLNQAKTVNKPPSSNLSSPSSPSSNLSSNLSSPSPNPSPPSSNLSSPSPNLPSHSPARTPCPKGHCRKFWETGFCSFLGRNECKFSSEPHKKDPSLPALSKIGGGASNVVNINKVNKSDTEHANNTKKVSASAKKPENIEKPIASTSATTTISTPETIKVVKKERAGGLKPLFLDEEKEMRDSEIIEGFYNMFDEELFQESITNPVNHELPPGHRINRIYDAILKMGRERTFDHRGFSAKDYKFIEKSAECKYASQYLTHLRDVARNKTLEDAGFDIKPKDLDVAESVAESVLAAVSDDESDE